jgi:hypothetical protein
MVHLNAVSKVRAHEKPDSSEFPLMLNAAIVPAHTTLCLTKQRGRLLELLLCEIRRLFPNVSYELDANSRTANAQALARGHVRVVRLYGGLAFHPMVGEDGLIFTLLHETGHHFAKGRRFALDPMLACDCAADKWAITTGVKLWQQAFGRQLDMPRAMDEVSAMISSMDYEPLSRTVAPNRKKPKQGYWIANWQNRMSRLRSAQLHAE